MSRTFLLTLSDLYVEQARNKHPSSSFWQDQMYNKSRRAGNPWQTLLKPIPKNLCESTNTVIVLLALLVLVLPMLLGAYCAKFVFMNFLHVRHRIRHVLCFLVCEAPKSFVLVFVILHLWSVKCRIRFLFVSMFALLVRQTSKSIPTSSELCCPQIHCGLSVWGG
jgi:hypothetical protein